MTQESKATYPPLSKETTKYMSPIWKIKIFLRKLLELPLRKWGLELGELNSIICVWTKNSFLMRPKSYLCSFGGIMYKLKSFHL